MPSLLIAKDILITDYIERHTKQYAHTYSLTTPYENSVMLKVNMTTDSAATVNIRVYKPDGHKYSVVQIDTQSHSDAEPYRILRTSIKSFIKEDKSGDVNVIRGSCAWVKSTITRKRFATEHVADIVAIYLEPMIEAIVNSNKL